MVQSPKGGLHGPPSTRHLRVWAIYSETYCNSSFLEALLHNSCTSSSQTDSQTIIHADLVPPTGWFCQSWCIKLEESCNMYQVSNCINLGSVNLVLIKMYQVSACSLCLQPPLRAKATAAVVVSSMALEAAGSPCANAMRRVWCWRGPWKAYREIGRVWTHDEVGDVGCFSLLFWVSNWCTRSIPKTV